MASRQGTSAFFAIAFAVTWTLQLPGALARLGWLSGDPAAYLPAAVLGVFGPLIAATYLTFREAGRHGLPDLFRGLLAWRAPPHCYFLALFLPGVLLSALLRLTGREDSWYFLPAAPQIVSAVVISVAEETGWSGYALPRLAARYGFFAGSCILGALWTVWHIPMFLAMGVPFSLSVVMLLFFVGGRLYFTWLYQHSGGSLLIAVLAHVGGHLNNSHAALPGDVLPLLVHTIVYASIGFALMRSAAFAPRRVAHQR
jgi:uncharacterized protein